MELKVWRNSKKLSQSACAAALALKGGARSYQRIEVGENSADADLVEKINVLTLGEVSADDMHRTRLSWLRLNRPEKFCSRSSPLLEAAE